MRARQAVRVDSVSTAAAARMTPSPAASLAVSDVDGKRELRLAGRLDAYSIAGVWPDARAALDAAPNVPVLIETSRVEYCDGGGIAMLVDLLRSAILPAGRSGAAVAAEIGTRKVNEELNALTTMGLDPVRFLVVTRIIAALLMMPLLVIFADLIGILGGALTMVSFNIPISAFLHEVDSLVDVKDLLAGLAKAPVFAILIAGIGCLRGLQTQTGASAVGISATRAVVSAIILLVVVDGIYAFVYYLLDI